MTNSTGNTTALVDRATLRALLNYLHDNEADHYDCEDAPAKEYHVYRHVLAMEAGLVGGLEYAADETERFKNALLEVVSDDQLDEALHLARSSCDDRLLFRRKVIRQAQGATEFEVAVFNFDGVDYRGTFTLDHDTGDGSPLAFERHDTNSEPRTVSDVHKAVRDCMEAEQAAIVASYRQQARRS